MAHTYTAKDGTKKSFNDMRDFLAEIVRRCYFNDKLPTLIEVDIEGMHITELVPITPEDFPPVAPLGAAGGLQRVGGG